MIVAVAVLLFEGDQLFVLRRAPHKVGAGLWESISGRVEAGESPLAAAKRELGEEAGLKREQVQFDERPICAYDAKRGSEPMVVTVYRAQLVSGEAQRSDEHDAERWVSVDEYEALAGETMKPLVDAARFAASLPW